MQRLAVGLAQHRAAAGGQHMGGTVEKFVENLLLEVSEGGFALTLEKDPDRAADAALDLGITVDEAPLEASRQVPADGGFASAGQADQGDEQKVSLSVGIWYPDLYGVTTCTTLESN